MKISSLSHYFIYIYIYILLFINEVVDIFVIDGNFQICMTVPLNL